MAEGDPPVAEDGAAIIARVGTGISAIDAAAWDALHDGSNPFVTHAFLAMLEESGSVGPGTGWQAAPILIDAPDGTLAAAAPAYLKAHSQGEYVFDQSWADAWQRAGGSYYPKLQIAVPFTPVPGPRVLAADTASGAALIAAAEALVRQNDLSSAHATFVNEDQIDLFRAAGWLIRQDCQFHWHNDSYADFDGFLATLSAQKRKQLRKERARAAADVTIEVLSGDAILPHHWDAMWDFYQDTGARKWGQPYLTRTFFTLLSQRMADAVILVLASQDGEAVAGALHFVGRDTLYGRYWGCRRDIPMLHFELCYYQAIDIAIARGLSRVEAGAQGGHKLARGYVPSATWSAHYLPDEGFRRAVADFLERERAAVGSEMAWLAQRTPFRKI
ncbi:MAG: hypothetical protein RLZZ58_1814 [Pseudomonadota bacterium]|jgi:predicted N-acyltransferase